MKRLTSAICMAFALVFAVACDSSEVKKADTKRPTQVPLVPAANETAVLVRLRSLVVAEQRCMQETAEYGSLEKLIQQGYLRDPSEGKLSGYRFDIRVTEGGFEITAVPNNYGVTGTRSFYVDQTNVVRASDKKGEPANASDPEA